MSGKVLVAGLAVAISSASAATVGVVYTQIVGARHIEALISPSDTAAAGSGWVKSAVVLNASGSESFGDFPVDGDAPGCAGETGRCEAGSGHSSGMQINILGKTRTIPPIWLGGNSEDYYGRRFAWPDDGTLPEILVHVGRGRIGKAGREDGRESEAEAANSDDSRASSNDGADTKGAWSSSMTTGAGPSSPTFVSPSRSFNMSGVNVPILETLAVDSPVSDSVGSEPEPFAPTDSPLADPTVEQKFTLSFGEVSRNDPAVPEPSTWVLMAAGFAALGVLKRRRLIAWLRPA